ncbi:MAG: hypothetical protein KatS3mg018_0132 [Fimbriimonadales bacterium]|nr:MAG: hypothetical protein KatS3mg018_0132 [Fimbriimonadales bacterium]
MQSLGVLASGESFGGALSSDGAVIVGTSDAPNWRRIAFRWTAVSGMQPVFNNNPYNSAAVDVSANGDSIVVNLRYFDGSSFVDFAIFTTPGGDYTLNPPVGNALSAEQCSADGTTIVGSMTIYPAPSVTRRAFRWTAQGGIQNLGALTNAALANSQAYCVSADGSIIYGSSEQGSGGNRVMFRWTPTEGMTSTGAAMTPADTTADGSIVVGTDADATRAVRWTQAGGMEDLNTTYAALIRAGWRLTDATAISSDGRYIVGVGQNTSGTQAEAFLLDTGCGVHNGDVNLDGCVDDADLLAVLFAFGNSGSNLGRVDVNCDGAVDDADLLVVLFNFGQGC